ncbi:protease modulator HflC [Luteolibacter pohnpeiensis]|uniref:Protein HflC n=1 Tax=Luteolibacter pohnpeiensis TaxID=454153 RepID=A0A934VVB2_9BACT|nr:protease modulator HflC [Luteolibacter pohnpeiensis]MBK1882005.1 protease modulator HflC [Luteolibacter pohnpeiensis]
MSRLQTLVRILIALAVAAFLGFVMCGFQVSSNECAVLTRFGSPVRTFTTPGLHLKYPWPIDHVTRFDRRLRFYDTRVSEALTRDKRNVILPVFIAWRIEDPLKFLQALGTPEAAPSKLDSLATSARNALLGGYDFQQLVATDPGNLKLTEIETRLTNMIAPQALDAFGIVIEQSGFQRIALPEANTTYVFDRMRAERGQYAAKYRAEGRQEAEELRARTDAEKTVLLAEAAKLAEETRGKAEAEAAHIYAEAHAKYPDFYRFTRELESLRKVTQSNTTLILDTDTSPFDLLKSSPLPVTPEQSGSDDSNPNR